MSVRNESIKFKNPTQNTIKLAAIGLEDVPANGEIDVPIELAAPGRTDNGTRAKSPIECVAPQLIPSNPTDHAAWREVPEPPTPVSKIVSIAARAPQEAPGVKALREKREAAAKAAQVQPAAKPATTQPSAPQATTK